MSVIALTEDCIPGIFDALVEAAMSEGHDLAIAASSTRLAIDVSDGVMHLVLTRIADRFPEADHTRRNLALIMCGAILTTHLDAAREAAEMLLDLEQVTIQ